MPADILKTDPDKGLTSERAHQRLKTFGPNKLPERPPPNGLFILFSQFKNPLVYVLITAGLITLFLNHISDTIIIFFAVFINAVLGFIQERRANRALYALKKLIHPNAHVLRDGKLKTIDVSEVVPGEIIILNQGDKISADGRLLEANRLHISEAILTGESAPVEKKLKDKVLMGTVVLAGQGKMLVETTGEKTEMGKIAEMVQEPQEDTPLRRQLVKFSKQLSFLAFVLVIAVLLIGLVSGRSLLEIFTTSVALAVSAIPEGLLVGLTVVLAIGMQRILKRKGLVRNLISAETLGGVTTICVDKTGTLTKGQMEVVDVIGDEKEIVKQVLVANDLDAPIVIAAYDWARKRIGNWNLEVGDLKRRQPRLDSIPFSSKDKFFACLNKGAKPLGRGNIIFVNGAPELLIEWSTLTATQRKAVKEKIEELTKEGKRVIGLARKEVSSDTKKLNPLEVRKNLSWIGLLAFSDPVRPGVRNALASTRAAGINLVVITGDYPQTAISVMKQLDIEIDKSCVVLGDELKHLSAIRLAQIIKDSCKLRLFARTTPVQKLKIVEALKKNGEVVAMTGDGVNDAPALNKADIGIVVGDATDVAKESADLVLLDSSFATIVAAIEEGRGIFDNVRKIILYLMSDAFEEIIVVVGGLILGLPFPVTAAQILWINLISDGFPDLALTVDPKRPGIMSERPRSPKEPLVSSWMKMLILLVSVSGGILALCVFILIFKTSGDYLLSRSVTFVVLGINTLIYVFSIRTLREPFWKEGLLNNRWLILAVFVGFAFQLLPFYLPSVGRFLGVVPFPLPYWLLAFATSGLMFIIIESSKVIFRRLFK